MQKNRLFSDDLTTIIPTEENMTAVEWLAEQMPGGFFIYHATDNLELLYVNQSTCDIFGCSTVEEFREHTGNTFKGMVHPDDFDSIQSSIEEQIAMESNIRNMDYVVYRIVRKDGSIRWVDDYGRFASLPGYGDVYYVFIEDITETKLAAETREKAKNLAAALQQAEHANEAKSAFLSNMSHEIRTPITAILGMNEMIQRETDDSVILDYSENIRKAGESLLGIISDILDFSKIETGRMQLDCYEYSVSSVVVDLYNLIQFRAEAKGLELKFYIDPNIPSKLIGDEIRVKQIVTNILTNAVKYTETGSVSITITMLDKTDEDVRISVSVKDTGIGIKDEDLHRLFEPFDRLDLKKTRTIEGSGLGLSITRQLLALMDSELKVESEYGSGSNFYFTLTQKIANANPIGKFELNEHIHDNILVRRKQAMFMAPGMRLLVVDDTPMNLQVIAGLLKRTRMHIDVATSGKECIDKFGNEHYDMVFLDYRMPMLDGIETLRELKLKYPDKYEKTPIISLTASAVSGDKEKMIKAGFTDYLSKPVNIDEMERMMIKYLPSDSVILKNEGGEEDDELLKLPDIIFTFSEIEPEKGIEYCGDADDYMFAIETFEMSIETKANQLEQNLADKDFEAFSINVHSLKSTSKAIGATSLFEKAKDLEQAAKERKSEILDNDTGIMLAEYRALGDVLKKILSKYEKTNDVTNAALTVVEEERNRVLAKALEEAERTNLAKTSFLSNMSHELRTPMNAIMGLYNLALRKPDLDADTKNLLTQMGEGSKHLLSLINDILDMSLIESGKLKMKHDKFSFSNMVEQINTMTEFQCSEKGISFECIIEGHLDDFYIGDDMKIKQALLNILDNAVKYTPQSGSVEFLIREMERNDKDATVNFVIKDTGVGIDDSYLPLLFEPFSKASEGTSNRAGSTGLGMAITQNIVNMMSGTIAVDTKRDVGTTFSVTIPLRICDDIRDEKYHTNFEKLNVLIVDDDITACNHAKMVLGKADIKADFVLNGNEAIEKIIQSFCTDNPYNIVLVDWKMPQMDGIELTSRLRESSVSKELTIILTTYNWYEIMEDAFKAGVDAFLSKPLFVGSIKDELDKILTERNKKISAYKKRGLAGKRVLLAEDMEINAQIMKQLLEFKSISTDIAENGQVALNIFKASPVGWYDAILMDIRMPKMDGLKAAKAIRDMERKDSVTVPIIALTANAFEEDIQLSYDAGMNAHLTKPVEPNILFETLENHIINRKAITDEEHIIN